MIIGLSNQSKTPLVRIVVPIFRHSSFTKSVLPHIQRLLASVSLLILVSLSIHNNAYCDSIKISGVPFKVDELTTIDEKLVKIRINDQTRIVSKEGSSDFIVKTYFESPELVKMIGLDGIESFIQSSAKEGRVGYASVALASILNNFDGDDPSVSGALERIGEDPLTEQSRKDAFLLINEKVHPSRSLCILVTAVARLDSSWVRSNAVKWIYILGTRLRLYLKETYYQSVARADAKASQDVLSVLAEFYGKDDADVIHLVAINSKINRLREGLQNNDPNALSPISELKDEDPALKQAIEPIVVNGIHRGAERLISKGQFEDALILLSHIELESRTPTTHQLISQSLDGIAVPSRELLIQKPVMTLLQGIAVSDSSVSEKYISFLTRGFLAHINSNNFDTARVSFSSLLMVRPDPNKENDLLRMKEVLALYRNGSVITAQERVSEIKTGISIFSRIRLVIYSLLGGNDTRILSLLFLFFSIPLIIIKSGRIFGVSPRSKRSNVNDYEYSQESRTIEDLGPYFVRLGSQGNSLVKEYNRALHSLGIDEHSGLKEIKAAYRSRVKEIHPDQNGAHGTLDPEQFIEVKKNYETILDIRKKLGLDT